MLEPCRTWAGARVSAISDMADNSGNDGEGGCGQRGQSLRGAGCRERQGARYGPSRELDLEAVVAGGLCLHQRRLGGATEQRGISSRAGQNQLRGSGAPGFHGNAAKREATFDNFTILDVQSGRRRYDRKSIGGTFANF